MVYQKNFKSFTLNVETYDDLLECLEPALSYQFMFERKTSPWEMSEWNLIELQEFKVDTVKIDRVYYAHCTENDFGSDFFVLFRMEYANKHVFVIFSANCDYTGFDCQGGGEIYITFNANNFFNEIIQNMDNEYQLNNILQALQEDGYHVDPNQESKTARIESWNNPPFSNFLCSDMSNDSHDILSCYQDPLSECLSYLPQVVAV